MAASVKSLVDLALMLCSPLHESRRGKQSMSRMGGVFRNASSPAPASPDVNVTDCCEAAPSDLLSSLDHLQQGFLVTSRAVSIHNQSPEALLTGRWSFWRGDLQDGNDGSSYEA